MKLYHDPNSRSVRPLVVLEEAGASYDLIPTLLSQGDHLTTAYRALHPLAQLPVLVDGSLTVFESTAICMYLAERFPDRRLAPPTDSPQRGPYYQWCTFVPGSLEPAFGREFQERNGGSVVPGTPALGAVLSVLSEALAERTYLLDSGYSVADAITGTTIALLPKYGVTLSASLRAYVERLRERPATNKAWSLSGL